jgi:hypothetical protein
MKKINIYILKKRKKIDKRTKEKTKTKTRK